MRKSSLGRSIHLQEEQVHADVYGCSCRYGKRTRETELLNRGSCAWIEPREVVSANFHTSRIEINGHLPDALGNDIRRGKTKGGIDALAHVDGDRLLVGIGNGDLLHMGIEGRDNSLRERHNLG